ncbi:MAG: acylphosphatase [Cyanobacteria bacterium P01_F01_bin.53]
MTPPSISHSTTPDQICLKVWITGRVQGVGYRYSTREQATALGLVGWVRKLPDGRVEAMIQGDRTQIERMIEWFHSGPPAAKVTAVETKEQTQQQFQTFEIRQ